MQDDQVPSWEKAPGKSIQEEVSQENIDRADEFASVMETAPEFAGDNPEEYDDEIAGAASLINYGVNAAASEMGVGFVVDKICEFDPSGLDNPIKGLYEHLGVDTQEEKEELRDERQGTKNREIGFAADSPNAQPVKRQSREGAMQAIKDLKELVLSVKTDPKYDSLRSEASAMGMNVFDYAVRGYEKQDFVTLMRVLAEQREANEDSLNDNSNEILNSNSNEKELEEMRNNIYQLYNNAPEDNNKDGEVSGSEALIDQKAA